MLPDTGHLRQSTLQPYSTDVHMSRCPLPTSNLSPLHFRLPCQKRRYYRNYKFIKDSINISNSSEDIYYVLVRKAALYIDFIEDGIKHDNYFPLDILDMFELTSWFESNIDKYSTNEIIIVLINKLFYSIYRTIFI